MVAKMTSVMSQPRQNAVEGREGRENLSHKELPNKHETIDRWHQKLSHPRPVRLQSLLCYE